MSAEHFDYQEIKVGDIVTYEQNTPQQPNFIRAEGKVRKVQLFFATRIAYLEVHITRVECGEVEIGEVVEIMHLQVKSFKDAICRANEFNYSPISSQELPFSSECSQCGRVKYTSECECEI